MNTKRSPWLSVVIPSRNPDKAALERSLHSLLVQEDAIEVLIVDDGSDLPIASWLGVETGANGNTVMVLRQESRGVSAARNAGLYAASSDLVAFLDDDDLLLPTWGRTMAALCTGTPRPAAAFVGATLRFRDGHELAVRPHDQGWLTSRHPGLFLAGTFLVDRGLAIACGGYDEALRFSENTDFGIRYMQQVRLRGGVVHFSPEPHIVINRANAGERSHRPRAMAESTERLLRLHEGTLRAESRARAQWHAIAGVNRARLDEWGAARKHFVKSALAQPWRLSNWGRLARTFLPRFQRSSDGSEE